MLVDPLRHHFGGWIEHAGFYCATTCNTLCRHFSRWHGATPEESKTVADALVEANLEGHDSHGTVRVPEYVGWMEEKLINIGAHMSVVKDAGGFAVLDGNWGWGQVVAKEAMEYGIKKALDSGAATISVSQCCHIGRVGDYPHRWLRTPASWHSCSLIRTGRQGSSHRGADANEDYRQIPFPFPFHANPHRRF